MFDFVGKCPKPSMRRTRSKSSDPTPASIGGLRWLGGTYVAPTSSNARDIFGLHEGFLFRGQAVEAKQVDLEGDSRYGKVSSGAGFFACPARAARSTSRGST